MNKKDQIKELQTNSKFTITTTICAVLLITFSVIGASLSKQTYSATNTANCKCVSNPAVSGGCGYTTSDVSSPGCELEGQPCSCPGGTGSSSSSSNPSSSNPSSSNPSSSNPSSSNPSSSNPSSSNPSSSNPSSSNSSNTGKQGEFVCNGTNGIAVGYTFSCTYKYNGTTIDGTMKYNSSSTSIVNNNGKALKEGSATVTVTFTPTSGTYSPLSTSKTLNVIKNEVICTLSPTSESIGVNETATFSLDKAITKVGSNTVNGVVTYSSSNQSIATVNSTSGVATGKGFGSASITAIFTPTDQNTYNTATCSASIRVTDSSDPGLTLGLGSTFYLGDTTSTLLTIGANTAGSAKVTISDSSKATIDGSATKTVLVEGGSKRASGTITLKSAGVVTVTVVFTPTDKENYSNSTKTASFTIYSGKRADACTVTLNPSGSITLYAGEKQEIDITASGITRGKPVGISINPGDTNIVTGGYGSGSQTATDTTLSTSTTINTGYKFGSTVLNVTITDSNTGASCSSSVVVNVQDKDLSKNGKLTFYNNYGGVYKIKYCVFSNNECTLDLLAFTCPPNYTFEGWTTAANCGGTLNSSGKQIKLTKDSPTASRYACCKDASGGQPSGTGGGGNGGGDNGDNGGGNTNTNPQTGSALIYTVWFIGIAMIGYSVWYFKQNSKIQNQ